MLVFDGIPITKISWKVSVNQTAVYSPFSTCDDGYRYTKKQKSGSIMRLGCHGIQAAYDRRMGLDTLNEHCIVC